jgi:hypothetical protein
MPLVLFAVANASLPPFSFFQMLSVCYWKVMNVNALPAFLDAQMAVEYVKKPYALD